MYRQKHKFKAKACEYNGIKFPSLLERDAYMVIERLKKAGRIVMFLRQVPFHLPGEVTYRVDFQVFWDDGTVSFIDAKGVETKEFILKKKQVEDLYPVEIEIWKRKDLKRVA